MALVFWYAKYNEIKLKIELKKIDFVVWKYYLCSQKCGYKSEIHMLFHKFSFS